MKWWSIWIIPILIGITCYDVQWKRLLYKQLLIYRLTKQWSGRFSVLCNAQCCIFGCLWINRLLLIKWYQGHQIWLGRLISGVPKQAEQQIFSTLQFNIYKMNRWIHRFLVKFLVLRFSHSLKVWVRLHMMWSFHILTPSNNWENWQFVNFEWTVEWHCAILWSAEMLSSLTVRGEWNKVTRFVGSWICAYIVFRSHEPQNCALTHML